MNAQSNHWSGLIDRAAVARKRGRKPLEEGELKRVISVSLPKAQFKALDAITKNRSGFIRELIERELYVLSTKGKRDGT